MMENKLDQVAIRMVRQPPLYSDIPITNPEAAIHVMHDFLAEMDRELFCIVNLQSDMKPINMNIVSVGALDQAITHPREILKSAILSNARSMILIHNHPSGSLTPSKWDIQTTGRMQQIGALIGIPLEDHIIVSKGDRYFSFREKEILPVPSFPVVEHLEDLSFTGGMAAENTASQRYDANATVPEAQVPPVQPPDIVPETQARPVQPSAIPLPAAGKDMHFEGRKKQLLSKLEICQKYCRNGAQGRSHEPGRETAYDTDGQGIGKKEAAKKQQHPGAKQPKKRTSVLKKLHDKQAAIAKRTGQPVRGNLDQQASQELGRK